MKPKPRQFGPQYASMFKDPSVVEAYRFRPPYPREVFEILSGLCEGEPRAVLDVGCGTGFVARELARYVDRVDAVDYSAGMIEAGRQLPGGDDSRLRWICAPAEAAALFPPYALVTAAASLHWLEWDLVLPRFGEVLMPGGVLAIVEDGMLPNPWDAELWPILGAYSMNRDHRPYDMETVAEELEARALFERLGISKTRPVRFRQTVDEYVESFHARNGFSRDRMDPAAAAACDAKVRRVVARHCPDGGVLLQLVARVIWGTPRGSPSPA